MALDLEKLKKQAFKAFGMERTIPVNVFGWDRRSYITTIDMKDAERLVYEGFAEPIRRNSIYILRNPTLKKKDKLYEELKSSLFESSKKKLAELE